MGKSRIKNWKVFNESTMASFGGGPFTGANPTALASGSPVQPNDPQLTTDAYDRIKNSINANQITLQRMTQSIFKNNNLNGKVGKYTNDLDLKELKILQMFRNQAGSLDVSIEFKFEGFDESFFGTFKNWSGYSGTTFRSGFLNNSKTWNAKVEAILKKTLLNWFKPELGDYKLIADQCRTWDSMGEIHLLKKGARVKVIDVQLENQKPIIHIKMGQQFRYITDLDYWWFKWFFDKIPDKKEINKI